MRTPSFKPRNEKLRPSQAPGSDATSLKRLELLERRQHIMKKNPLRLRIVQSVHAGHVRGGHGFH